MAQPPRDALYFPASDAENIIPYLPPPPLSSLSSPPSPSPQPFITLTFATSLDTSLSLSPGLQTALSGPASKAMTHFLRSRHSAILIGSGTAIADNPSLNCRIAGVGGYGGSDLTGQPRPIVVDPSGKWDVHEESKVVKLAREGRGRGVWIVTAQEPDARKSKIVEDVGGKILRVVRGVDGKVGWRDIIDTLAAQGVTSVMIEGGGHVINDLLRPENFGLVDSVIVTVAPVWLGKGGVQVCPDARVDEQGERVPVGRLRGVKWVPLGEDVVLCGKPKLESIS
jgi:2,5-diamino-6-(ribosylamino)-4(3H)-pyrimidinone 5'-phosphate reductase